MNKIKWKKIASVTTGGKSFFYNGNAIGSSVFWNRVDKKYIATLWGQTVGKFNDVKTAKKAIQNKFDLTKFDDGDQNAGIGDNE